MAYVQALVVADPEQRPIFPLPASVPRTLRMSGYLHGHTYARNTERKQALRHASHARTSIQARELKQCTATLATV